MSSGLSPSGAVNADGRKNGVQRVQRARRGAAVANGSNEIDQIILDEMKREVDQGPSIPADTIFTFTTNTQILPPHTECTARASDFRTNNHKSYFDRPEVIESYRNQQKVETPDYELITDDMIITSRFVPQGVEGTSDSAYDKRHKRFERVEKSSRLRDIERLQNKQYHLHERIEQLKSVDTIEDEDPATVDKRALATGIAETREGERRRHQMLRTGLALEARLKASLTTRRKKGAYNASPSRPANGALQHASTSSSSIPDDTTDAYVPEVLAPIPQQPRLTVKKPYYPGLVVDDDQDSDYQDIPADVDVDDRDEWHDAAIPPPKKRRRSDDDDFYDDGYKRAAKKKSTKTPKVKDMPAPRGAVRPEEQGIPSFKIKLPARDLSRVSTPTLAKGKGRSLDTSRPQLPVPTHPSLPIPRNLARPLDAVRNSSLSPMTSIDDTEDDNASRVHRTPLNRRSPSPPRTIYSRRQPTSQPIPITPRRRSPSPSTRSHDGPFPLPPPPPPSSTKKRKAEESVAPHNNKKQKVQAPDAPPKRGPGRPRKEEAAHTPAPVVPPTPAPAPAPVKRRDDARSSARGAYTREATHQLPDPTPEPIPAREPSPLPAAPTPTPQPATPAAASSTSRRSVTRGPEAKKKDGLMLTIARNSSGKGGRAPRHLTAFGAAMPAALAKDPKVWGPETTDYELPRFIADDPMVKTGRKRIEKAFSKRHR
ncbi:hypothetical protein BDZ89DRAFT_1128784 [Hymenopellis radicata]|nr:hypothetical protein BDZ89DRAFT_1128784 [Hymenopellis radicata]